MDKLVEIYKEKGCEYCGSFKEKDKLLQKEDGIKNIEKIPYCNLFKQELKDMKACDKFTLSFMKFRDETTEETEA